VPLSVGEPGRFQQKGRGLVAPEDLVARIAEALFTICRWLAGLALILTIIVVTAEIIMRNYFGQSLQLSEEYGAYLLVAMMFLGFADSYRAGALMRIEVVYDAFSPRARAVVDLIYDVLAFFAVGILAWFGLRMVISSINRGSQAPTLIETPLWIPQLSIPIGLSVLLAALALTIADDVARLSKLGTR
jgi:TRAP-type C4-dicarboxylate transport system permease small subunit